MIPLVGRLLIGLYLAFFTSTIIYTALQPATCAESQGYRDWVRWVPTHDALGSHRLGLTYACPLDGSLGRSLTATEGR